MSYLLHHPTLHVHVPPRLRKLDWLRILLGSVLILLPLVETILLLRVFFGASLLDFVPATDDEILLWHQESTFNAVGFSGGYYTYEEQPASWAVSHYAAHGPFFPLFYGTLGRLVGWHPYTGVVLNVTLIMLALTGFLAATRPSKKQILILAALLATFWGLVYELPSNSQEAAHLAFAIVMTAVFWRLLKRDGPPRLGVVVGLCFLILLFSLLRPFWSLLLVPLALIATRRQSRRRQAFAVLCALALIGMVFFAVVYISAPYPGFVRTLLDTFQRTKFGALNLLLSAVVRNVAQFFGQGETNFLSLAERLVMLALILIFGSGIARNTWRARKNLPAELSRLARPTTLFHIFNIGTILATLILLYVPGGYQGFRVLAPYLLMTVLMLTLEMQFSLVLLVVVVNLITLPFFVGIFQEQKARNFFYDHVMVESFYAQTRMDLAYDATDTPWCNTLLVDGSLFCLKGDCKYALEIPPGRGLSLLFYPDRLSAPLKSKYLLLGNAGKAAVAQELGGQVHLQPLYDTVYGTLYKNQDAACH